MRKGQKMSEEHKQKLREAAKKRYAEGKHPRLGAKLSDETKRKIGAKSKGRPKSRETRQKLSQSLKKRYENQPHHSKGITLTEEHKRKVGEASKGRKQSVKARQKRSEALKKYYRENPHPGKGKPRKPHTEEARRKMSEARRDDELCQACFGDAKGDKGNVHHRNADKTDCRPENLILVCDSCHSLIHHSTKDADNEMILKFRLELT